jgi:predicted dehydrogenase
MGLSSALTPKTMASIKRSAPGDRVNIAVIGLDMGCADMNAMLANDWVHCVGMCDVNRERLETQAADFKKRFPDNAGNIRLYKDFREVLDNKDVDGVIIATPDHWHAYIFAEALQAGKAIYVEKPVANSIAECNVMMDLQAKYRQVVSTGLWQTSQRYFLGANEILKTGVLGDVYKVQVFLCQSTNPRPVIEDSEPPATLDYDTWLGPAPWRPYNQARVRGWRGYWDYGGGQQTDWGVHWIDSAFDGLAALGINNRTYPKAVFSTATKDPASFNETPSCQTSIFQYENFHIEWAQQVAHLYNRNQGVAWIGSKATLLCNRDGYELIPEKKQDGSLLTDRAMMVGKFEDRGLIDHTRNWGECIRKKSIETNSPLSKGAFATILAQVANISYKTGAVLTYDPHTRTFAGNAEANTFLKPSYRRPWEFPGLKTFLTGCLCLLTGLLSAQSVSFVDDERQRGYYDRPYKRYEAEPGRCSSNGLFLSPTYVQTELQSEASNVVATQLIRKGSYVQWINDEEADGLLIRFSIPDSKDGKGSQGLLALYAGETFIQHITLDSYWAWQYALMTGQTYPDNMPSEKKFARMRFDEKRVRLADKIPAGATFKLVKADDNPAPYTIDFVELEPVPTALLYDAITDANKVRYTSSSGPLPEFIANHGGKTIYIPEGRYEVNERIRIHEANTKLIGAGMWYTELYFSAPPDDAATYDKRGIQTNQDQITLEGLYLTTANNRRYFILDNARNGQVGKGLMGSFGTNSSISNLWIEHFECGGWIDGASNLSVQHCRFRNNYADGINLSLGSKHSNVTHCSFRNNGDDDMASWSRGQVMCEGIVYQYNTAENNWRASSVGFFGGKDLSASDLVVIDPMEAALRVTTDFPGREFSDEGCIAYSRISVYRAGGQGGPLGFYGDIIDGSESGAIHITAYSKYDIRNVRFSDIDLYDSKADALFMDCANGKRIENLSLENIRIWGAGRYGISFHRAVGEAFYRAIRFENTGAGNLGPIPPGFRFTSLDHQGAGQRRSDT